jgi:hypothetical protein
MADPAPQQSLKRVWIWILVLIIALWIVYALTGGTSTPKTGSVPDSASVKQH